MTTPLLLEAVVDSLDAAIAAQSAGADRLELCAALELGGLTPSAGMLAAVKAAVTIPVFAMVRPRAGGFTYTEQEFACMLRDAEILHGLGADGIVGGVLRVDPQGNAANLTVDVARTAALVKAGRSLPFTFHRAFDRCPDWGAALEDVIASGATRILTSGGAANAHEGISRLATLMERAAGRIGILPGGGVHAGNAAAIVEGTGVGEIHFSAVRTGEFMPDPAKVAAVRAAFPRL